LSIYHIHTIHIILMTHVFWIDCWHLLKRMMKYSITALHSTVLSSTVLSEPCGEPIPSTDPWPEQNESGGGVHIPWNYIIKPVHLLESILSKLQHSISNMKAGKCMSIVQKQELYAHEHCAEIPVVTVYAWALHHEEIVTVHVYSSPLVLFCENHSS